MARRFPAAYTEGGSTNAPITVVRTTDGPTDLTVGNLFDGEFLTRVAGQLESATITVADFTSGANNPGEHGLVPAPLLGDITKFLRGDATWATVVAGITALTGDVTASGSGSVVATIANLAVSTAKIAANAVTNTKLAQVATATFKGRTTAGTGDPEDLTVTQATALLNAFTSGANNPGLKGLVPAPLLADVAKFLKADGTWATAGGAITTQEEGVTVSTTVTTLNFIGLLVTLTGGGTVAAITVASLGGTTAARPVTPANFTPYFDTTLGIPITYLTASTSWVNAAGVAV